MPVALLTAAIIVRNEADHLRRCLGSIQGLCDEIVVVDTGSQDNTVAVAHSFGARVLHKTWNDDFAASRNVALDAVDSEWVLYIDADEEVVDTEVAAIRARLGDSADVMAFGISMVARQGWTPYRDFRIWRHRSDIRFRGEIHESSTADIVRVAEETGRVLAPIDVTILHHGYSGDQTHKNQRNLPLLRAELENDPDNINLWNHLGRVNRELGREGEAEAAWAEGVRRVRENGLRRPNDVNVFASLADLLASRGEDPTDVLREAKTFGTGFHTLTWLEAKYLLDNRRFDEAVPLLRELVEVGLRGAVSDVFSYNTAMFDAWPKVALANAAFEQCLFGEAIERLEEARAAGLNDESARPRIQACRRALEYLRSPAPNRAVTRVAMPDVAFVIALRVDSGDRLRNIESVVGRILSDFDARVVVGCEDAAAARGVLADVVEVVEVPGDVNHPFHVTRVLNVASGVASTSVRVHLDADVIIPPSQIIEAVRRVRTGECGFVLPFTFGVGVPIESQSEFMRDGPILRNDLGLHPMAGEPLGGCQVWSAETFSAVGGENEFFIGWGPEDAERVQRLRTLGHQIERVSGPMFHLDHRPSPLSREHSTYRDNNDSELDRIRAMSKPELLAEVSGWPWVDRDHLGAAEPLEAGDLTVTIPVRLDTTDRLRNLVSSTNALAHATTARIVVGVGDPARLERLQADGVLHERVEVTKVHDPPDLPFHRTRILNELAMGVRTPFVANLDADVVVPVGQWREALSLLRSGEASFVLPYDGRMIEVSYGHHPWLERGEYGSLPRVNRRVMHPRSVGGCVVWRLETFKGVGMENENLVSWGYDDDERVARATTLGVPVRRVDGVVYHLEHRRGVDSRHDHPLIEANRAVLNDVQSMDADALRAHVETWPWLDQAAAVVFLVWNDTWHDDSEILPLGTRGLDITRDRGRFAEADVVLYSLPGLDISEIPIDKGRQGQTWILLCRESSVNFPLLATNSFRSRFDLVSSYELSSDLPVPYLAPSWPTTMRPTVRLQDRVATPACAWVSGPWDRSGRKEFMSELMLYMGVDSYGRVLNNTGDTLVREHERRLAIMTRYRFALALENSIAEDYVTEKVFDALSVGAVPVYLGAPNVDRFLPGDNCIVDASRFSSVSELAEFLAQMSDDEYMKFHEWRERPFRREFLELCSSADSLATWTRAQVVAVR